MVNGDFYPQDHKKTKKKKIQKEPAAAAELYEAL